MLVILTLIGGEGGGGRGRGEVDRSIHEGPGRPDRSEYVLVSVPFLENGALLAASHCS